jgi:protein-disulfide isomerase
MSSVRSSLELGATVAVALGQGVALAARTGARGTPTIWLNGRIVTPDLESVRAAIGAAR